jgi:hypothetical protein
VKGYKTSAGTYLPVLISRAFHSGDALDYLNRGSRSHTHLPTSYLRLESPCYLCSTLISEPSAFGRKRFGSKSAQAYHVKKERCWVCDLSPLSRPYVLYLLNGPGGRAGDGLAGGGKCGRSASVVGLQQTHVRPCSVDLYSHLNIFIPVCIKLDPTL